MSHSGFLLLDLSKMMPLMVTAGSNIPASSQTAAMNITPNPAVDGSQ